MNPLNQKIKKTVETPAGAPEAGDKERDSIQAAEDMYARLIDRIKTYNPQLDIKLLQGICNSKETS